MQPLALIEPVTHLAPVTERIVDVFPVGPANRERCAVLEQVLQKRRPFGEIRLTRPRPVVRVEMHIFDAADIRALVDMHAYLQRAPEHIADIVQLVRLFAEVDPLYELTRVTTCTIQCIPPPGLSRKGSDIGNGLLGVEMVTPFTPSFGDSAIREDGLLTLASYAIRMVTLRSRMVRRLPASTQRHPGGTGFQYQDGSVQAKDHIPAIRPGLILPSGWPPSRRHSGQLSRHSPSR